MANSVEDAAAGCLAKLFLISLVISGIGWLAKKIFGIAKFGVESVSQWGQRVVVPNLGSIVAILVGIVALRTIIMMIAVRASFRKAVRCPMEAIEGALNDQNRHLDAAARSARERIAVVQTRLRKMS